MCHSQCTTATVETPFYQVLNVISSVDAAELEKIEQRPCRSEFDDLPSREDLKSAMNSLKMESLQEVQEFCQK